MSKVAKLTRNGVCYDLANTPYKYTLTYENEDKTITYSFSSELCMNRFKEQIELHRTKISDSLTKRFGIIVLNNILADIVLYSKAESRGFYILINEVEYTCLNSIKLVGVNQI